MMILVQAIKEVTTIQQVKDKCLYYVNQQTISYNSLLQTENWPGIDRLWMTPWHIKYDAAIHCLQFKLRVFNLSSV